MPEIVLKNVTKRFGKFTAVDNLNLTIQNNAFVTLLGPSGCGKTTTLRMIAGLEDPTEGSITIDGKTVFDADRGINLSPDKRDVGFLFQNYALWPHMTVYQNIAFGLENLKWDKPSIRNRVTELLEMLKIGQFEERYPSELSGGQQQRVAIARTLAPKPQVLFMDEPLSNLDAKLRMEMRAELKRLHIDTKATFVYVTHDQLEAMTLSTKVCIMEEGALKQYAPPLEMYARPSSLFVADFMGNPPMNFLHGTAKVDKPGAILVEAGDWEYTFESSEEISLKAEKVVLCIRL
ncbi:MAG: ABC transporter ATP-binding protein, partial [Clostridiales bacterium]|nr:ABC transporter ATP-binding protein [Clostridiales bacterium]